jgi:MscS family membrane protein
MYKMKRIFKATHCLILILSLALVLVTLFDRVMAQAVASGESKDSLQEGQSEGKPEVKKISAIGPADEYDRGVPRSSVKGYFKATRDGDYELAAQYLDLRNLPRGMKKSQGPELARHLKVVLDRTMWVDLDTVSDDPKGHLEDGLPTYRDSLGRLKTPKRTFSNRTVAQIPHLYRHFGYGPFEERLSKLLPDYTFLGWQMWQWVLFLVFIGLAYVAALLPTWFTGFLLTRKETEFRLQTSRFITGPVRILLWLLLLDLGVHFIGPSITIRTMMRGGTLIIIAFTWTFIGATHVAFSGWAQRLRKSGQETAIVLLQPVKKIIIIITIAMAILLWLDNIGFNISALLAGLGVGGIAIALACQDTLKNFIGSIMVLLDKPYRVGQRIVVRGHDGIVEQIGLRSTRMRLLNGHQTTIPNEEMARVDIENIGRRPHIRRLAKLTITYDTPPDKIEKAVEIILKILENHEGMDPEFPPRAYFSEFNRDSLNLLVLYWYHPADYWGFMAHSQQVNLKILREFEKEGIKFAFPTHTTYLAQDGVHPLQVGFADDSQLKVVTSQ